MLARWIDGDVTVAKLFEKVNLCAEGAKRR
jgi:hypothetical protein